MTQADYDIEQIRDIARELAHQIDWLSRTRKLGGCPDWDHAHKPYEEKTGG